MSKKEKPDTSNLSFAEQFQNLMPDIKKIHANMALKNRVQKIYKSMGEFSWSYAEELWPSEQRSAFTERLLTGDSKVLSELEEMEKKWLD